jgi:hypothetical protein
MLRSLDWIVYGVLACHWQLGASLCIQWGDPEYYLETWSGNLPPEQELYSVTHFLVCFV